MMMGWGGKHEYISTDLDIIWYKTLQYCLVWNFTFLDKLSSQFSSLSQIYLVSKNNSQMELFCDPSAFTRNLVR